MPKVETHIQYPRKLCMSDSMSSRCLNEGIKEDSQRLSLTRHKHPVSLCPLSLSLSLFFLCKGLPLKDEKDGHEHEPLMQARQHRTAIANGMSSGGMGGVGVRHHGVGARMSPLEIGMYVLLAAFCFAIVVFVVSCVVYASKFKPQPPDSPLTGAAVPVLSGAGARARAAANQLASGRRPPRESTTNAHDWVWLGRATLERAACGPQQVRTSV